MGTGPNRNHLAREKVQRRKTLHGNQEKGCEEEKETLTVARGRYLAQALSEFQKASREKHLLRGFFVLGSDRLSVVGRQSLVVGKIRLTFSDSQLSGGRCSRGDREFTGFQLFLQDSSRFNARYRRAACTDDPEPTTDDQPPHFLMARIGVVPAFSSC